MNLQSVKSMIVAILTLSTLQSFAGGTVGSASILFPSLRSADVLVKFVLDNKEDLSVKKCADIAIAKGGRMGLIIMALCHTELKAPSTKAACLAGLESLGNEPGITNDDWLFTNSDCLQKYPLANAYEQCTALISLPFAGVDSEACDANGNVKECPRNPELNEDGSNSYNCKAVDPRNN